MVLPFTFPLKCSQDIVQGANGMTKNSPFRGLTDVILGGLKLKGELISQEQQMKRVMLTVED